MNANGEIARVWEVVVDGRDSSWGDSLGQNAIVGSSQADEYAPNNLSNAYEAGERQKCEMACRDRVLQITRRRTAHARRRHGRSSARLLVRVLFYLKLQSIVMWARYGQSNFVTLSWTPF